MQFSAHGSGQAMRVSAVVDVAMTLYCVFLLLGVTSLSCMNSVSF